MLKLAKKPSRALNIMAVLFVAAFAIFGVTYILRSSAATNANGCVGVNIPAGSDIQAAINANGINTTFCIQPGFFRITNVITPKAGSTLWGHPGTIINGAKPLTSWAASGSTWYTSGVLPPDYVENNYSVCEDTTTNLCKRAERVYRNNVLLTSVATLAEVGPGKFYSDYSANRVYVGDQPSGATMELSSVRRAITAPQANITIRDLTVEKFATLAQRGAIEINGAGWTVKNTELRFNHGAGLHIIGGGSKVTGNYIHHNGQTGITAWNNSGTLIDRNVISYNNTDGFWLNDGENGGIKITKNAMTISNNYIHHNRGMGVWADIDNRDVIISGNYISDNSADGVRYEISYDGLITGNILVRNGFDRGRSADGVYLGAGAAVLVNNSTNDIVEKNSFYDNDKGIGLVEANRGAGIFGTWELKDVTVRNNNVSLTGPAQHGLVQYVGNTGYYTSKGNTFTGNSYHFSPLTSNRFQWMNGLRTPAQWQAYGNDTTASGSKFDSVIPTPPAPPALVVGPQGGTTSTATPAPTASPTPSTASKGDIDGNGKINVIDLSMLLSSWGTNSAKADIDRNQIVNVLDLSILLVNWTK